MAKARRICRTDGCDEDRARGNAHSCHECWLAKQPTHVQVEYADARLAAVPVELRQARIPEADWPPGRRWCSGCQSFVRLVDCSGSRCRACCARTSREYRLRADYSIDSDVYRALMIVQDGRCYICRRKSHRVPLAVDHDHRTGEVRGLLCADPSWGCNQKIMSRIDADPDPMAMALRIVSYLREPPARRVMRSS